MSRTIEVGGRRVGHGQRVYVIAEAGLNHGGDLGAAIGMIEAAAAAGADAIKFQAFETDSRFVDDDAARQLVRPAQFGRDEFATLATAARRHRIDFACTAFDEEKVEMLAALQVAAIKIASCDISNHDLLRKVARAGVPAILSRGTAGRPEIDKALRLLGEVGLPHVLLHCVSSYPLRPEDANLAAIHTLRETYDVPIGYSDHTPGMDVPLHAVYAGACVLEKHFTLDRELRGIDWELSINPEELAALVADIRVAERVLGDGRLEPMPCEEDEVRYRVSRRTTGE